MTGRELVRGLWSGAGARPPYVPILGGIASVLGQVSLQEYTTDPQAQAVALAVTAAALHADAVTVGLGTDPGIGASVVARVQPLLEQRAVVACLDRADVAAVRAYCEAGVDMVMLVKPDRSVRARFRTIANACAFYGVAAVLVDPQVPNATAVAAELGLHGAVVARPGSQEPGILGGGLSGDDLHTTSAPAAPRAERFFWSFPDEVPADANPELLAALGVKLAASS